MILLLPGFLPARGNSLRSALGIPCPPLSIHAGSCSTALCHMGVAQGGEPGNSRSEAWGPCREVLEPPGPAGSGIGVPTPPRPSQTALFSLHFLFGPAGRRWASGSPDSRQGACAQAPNTAPRSGIQVDRARTAMSLTAPSPQLNREGPGKRPHRAELGVTGAHWGHTHRQSPWLMPCGPHAAHHYTRGGNTEAQRWGTDSPGLRGPQAGGREAGVVTAGTRVTLLRKSPHMADTVQLTHAQLGS